MMQQPPKQPTPVGALRFNTDSAKLEYFDGNQYVNITTDSPVQHTGGTRGFAAGGYPNSDVIDFYNIDTTGNAVDFGDRTISGQDPGSASSRTRGLMAAGHTGSNQNIIDFVTMASTGNAQDFGDVSLARHGVSKNFGDATRGIFVGGVGDSGFSNIIEYVTIASTGDTKDFGDTSVAIRNGAGGSSPTRSVFYVGKSGSSSGSDVNTIEYLTTSTLGNSSDFGDLTFSGRYGVGGSNAIRCILQNGQGADIDFVTIATLGNALEFGELSRGSTSTQLPFCATSPTRIVIGGGQNPKINTMEYAQIMTTGNFVDFGDATITNSARCGFSNGHGGLG
tara:strand:- start:19 stop:1026 length:1008 start_codon:yes stop_codon:yes gene_type:complete